MRERFGIPSAFREQVTGCLLIPWEDQVFIASQEENSAARRARAAGLSASRLRHLFRDQTGDSPRRFQERQRLRKACDLLSQSRQTIGEIALELGFNNPFYFTLRFKKEMGENPRAYRLRTTRH